MKETQTRPWWMEVIRGVITIAFGLLFIFIDVRFFISLGKRVTKRQLA